MRKRKLIVALASLCAVLFVSVVGMGIWAATNQTVQSRIKVTYSVTDVAVTVSANRYFANNTAHAFVNSTSGTSLVINARDTSVTDYLSADDDTVLTSTNDYVVFEYVFTNRGDNIVSAALAVSVPTNMTIYSIAPTLTSARSNQWTGFNPAEHVDPEDNTSDLVWAEWNESGNVISATNIASGATVYAYIVMKITNADTRSSFDSTALGTDTFTWTLTAVNS